LVGLLADLTGCLADRQAKTQIAAKRGAVYVAERAANVVRGVEPGRQLKRYGCFLAHERTLSAMRHADRSPFGGAKEPLACRVELQHLFQKRGFWASFVFNG